MGEAIMCLHKLSALQALVRSAFQQNIASSYDPSCQRLPAQTLVVPHSKSLQNIIRIES
jgi:hypothetical protein